MSKSNAKKLVDKLSKDKKFRDALLSEEVKVALKFAKKAGIECTPEELKEISGAVRWMNVNLGNVKGITSYKVIENKRWWNNE
jgi:hypothetical protein